MIDFIPFGLAVIAMAAAWRIDWVANARMDVLHADDAEWTHKFKTGQWYVDMPHLPRFDSLPSFNEMMFKFWIWDVNKFMKH